MTQMLIWSSSFKAQAVRLGSAPHQTVSRRQPRNDVCRLHAQSFSEMGLACIAPPSRLRVESNKPPRTLRRHLTNRVQLVQVHIGSGTRSTVAEAGLSVPPRTRFSMRLLIVCRRFYRETARYL